MKTTNPITQIKYFSYTLQPKAAPNSRSLLKPRAGTLLRIQFDLGDLGQATGYADCFPWPELGDQPLSEQLRELKRGGRTPILKRSLFFALQDAQARIRGKSLFEGLSLPKSHCLLTDFKELSTSWIESRVLQGFNLAKLKVGKDPGEEAEKIAQLAPLLQTHAFKLRLDFNSTLSFDQTERFLERIEPSLPWIDFLEDPFPFEAKMWSAIRNQWGVRLALDRCEPELFNLPKQEEQDRFSGLSVLVIKPASQDPTPLLNLSKRLGLAVVFTSSMDHPLGQLCAVWSAGTASSSGEFQIEPGGFLSQDAYLPTPWHAWIQCRGPELIAPPGPGWTEDDLLKTLAWQPL